MPSRLVLYYTLYSPLSTPFCKKMQKSSRKLLSAAYGKRLIHADTGALVVFCQNFFRLLPGSITDFIGHEFTGLAEIGEKIDEALVLVDLCIAAFEHFHLFELLQCFPHGTFYIMHKFILPIVIILFAYILDLLLNTCRPPELFFA